MNRTSIEWTDFTANPVKYLDSKGKTVWGCVHASPGCKYCYAESIAQRFNRGGAFNVTTMKGLTVYVDEAELYKMRTAKTIGGMPVSGSRCFVGDMTDIFGEWVPDEVLDRLFAVFALRPDVTWQLLTKRAERMREYLCYEYRWAQIELTCYELVGRKNSLGLASLHRTCLQNVWLGVSCEDQQRSDERIPVLLGTPAAVRWVSAEPLLGPIDFALRGVSGWDEDWHYDTLAGHEWASPRDDALTDGSPHLDWMVVGGESGPHARPCHLTWVRSIVDQCKRASVPVFVKQLGAVPVIPEVDPTLSGPRVLKAQWHIDGEWPDGTHFGNRTGELALNGRVALLKDSKGGDMAEWPKDLRVREWLALPASGEVGGGGTVFRNCSKDINE